MLGGVRRRDGCRRDPTGAGPVPLHAAADLARRHRGGVDPGRHLSWRMRGKDPLAAYGMLVEPRARHVLRHHRDAHPDGAVADRQRGAAHLAPRRRLEHRHRRAAHGRRPLRRGGRGGGGRAGREPGDVAGGRAGRHGWRVALGARPRHPARALGAERDHHHADDELCRAQRDLLAGEGTRQGPRTSCRRRPSSFPARCVCRSSPARTVHIGLLVGLIVVLLVTILFRHTVIGFMLDVVGGTARPPSTPACRSTD